MATTASGTFSRAIDDLLDKKLDGRVPDLLITTTKELRCSVKLDAYTQFYDVYCKAAYRGVEENRPLSVVQLPKGSMPFVVRFNLRFNSFANHRNAVISDRAIVALAQGIQDFLEQRFDFDADSNSPACCILASDLIHLTIANMNYSTIALAYHFPMCKVDSKKLTETYIPDLCELLQEAWPGGNGLFEVVSCNDTWDKMLDTRLYTEGIPYYGSTYPNEDIPCFLKFFGAYDAIPAVVDNDYDYQTSLLDESNFDPCFHTKVAQKKISKTLFSAEYDKHDWYWLPLVLSIDYWSTLVPEMERNKHALEEREQAVKPYDIIKLVKKDADLIPGKRKSLENLRALALMWDPNRMMNRGYSVLLGEALFDIHRGETRGLSEWVSFLRASLNDPRNRQRYYTNKNIRRRCEKVYYTFERHRTTFGTVEHYAEIDSPELYADWKDKRTALSKIEAINGLEGDVAVDFEEEFPNKFRCAKHGNMTRWYVFGRHTWRVDHGGITLKKYMSRQYLAKIIKMRRDVNDQLGDYSQEIGDLVISKLDKLIKNLKKQHFKSTLLGALEERYNNRHFEGHLDMNPEVMGTPTGVINATDVDISFRDGRPEDYTLKSTKAMLRRELSWDHPLVEQAWMWSRKTFVDPDTVEYFWRYMSSILRRRNSDKVLMFWSGPKGNNSKSMWIRALSCVLGEYLYKIPEQLLVQGRGKANDASPVEAAANGCAIVIAEEPGSDTPLLDNIIKSETGDDDKNVRGLYQEPRQQVATYKFAVVCNRPPPVGSAKSTNVKKADQQPIHNRVRVTPFESVWTNNAPKSIAEQFSSRTFKLDPFFNKKIPTLAPAILWIMYQKFGDYLEFGLDKQPKAVTDVTKKYWKDNNRYAKFMEEVVEVGGPNDTVSTLDMYRKFSAWHRTSYGYKLEVPDKFSAIESLEDEPLPGITPEVPLGKPIAGGWTGIRLKDDM